MLNVVNAKPVNAGCFGRCCDKTHSWQLAYTAPAPQRIPNNNRLIFAALSDRLCSLLQTWGPKASSHTARNKSSVLTTFLLPVTKYPHSWERQIKSVFAGGKKGAGRNVMCARNQPFSVGLGSHLVWSLIVGKTHQKCV